MGAVSCIVGCVVEDGVDEFSLGELSSAIADGFVLPHPCEDRPSGGCGARHPYPLWTGSEAPDIVGATFQRENEFGVFARHAWIWRNTPTGCFAGTNPDVFCGPA